MSMSSSVVYAAEVSAADAPVQAATQQPSMVESLVPFLFIFVIMYFLLIRPQSKKAKEHANLISAIKVGDEVVTSSGIIGRVKSIQESFVTLDLGQTSVKMLKEHISRLTKDERKPTVVAAQK